MFYFNPTNFHYSEKTLFRCKAASDCEGNRYLEDYSLGHEELQECDKEINKMLTTWAGGVYKAIELKVLAHELDQRVSGLYWCPIL